MHPVQPLLDTLGGHGDSGLLSLFDLLESACEGSVLVDAKCRVLWVSEKYRPLLGLAEDLEVEGREIEEIIPNSLMRQVVERGEPQLLDLMRFGERWFVVTRLPLKDRAGKIQGAIGFVFYQQLDRLRPLVDRFTRLQEKPTRRGTDRTTRYSFADMVGSSPALLRLRQQALRAAHSEGTVLLLGETGTGKEILAQAMHTASPRANGPFVGVNTAALPDTLVEAELFGAAPGAYTGADRRGRQGKFELARGGTLFLDEIGDISADVQSKLLRVLEERQVEPLGSNRLVPVDVRVIAATSRDLEARVAEGQFRADLFYRLNVLPLTLPPLRERLEDLPELCESINLHVAEELGGAPLVLDSALLDALRRYHWPGNVRELRNVLERAHLFAENGRVPLSALSSFIPVPIAGAGSLPYTDGGSLARAQEADSASVRPLAQALADAERDALATALRQHRGNKSRAAQALGISRATLYEKLQRHGNLLVSE
ncbi:sigma-54-dependent Fis family transcriptional regulator [Motiliproteus sp. SC1-56]|uniref:sigma-54 interaction domain-containing protein n=1 Tax=Motiliproteus sp. SC1-56 TaxID=2799565 RepID=UPI001A8C8D01|nr:sigma 54-interacting transcriptional regulator [Motiliproteus sp. SC1-56]